MSTPQVPAIEKKLTTQPAGYSTLSWHFNGTKYSSEQAAINARTAYVSGLRYQGQGSQQYQQSLANNEAARQAASYTGKAEQHQRTLANNEAARQAASYTGKAEQAYAATQAGGGGGAEGGGGTGGSGAAPRPVAQVDARTQAQKETDFYAAYNSAIDKAIAGDPTEMKNLDKFFTGAERAPIGYDPGYLQLERRAQAAGVSIDQQKANETALATSATKLIRGDGPINPDDGGANTGNGAAVFAVNVNGEKFHITGNAAQDMRNNGTWTEPVVVSQSVVDGMAFKGRIEWSSELSNINPAPVPEVSSGTPLIPQPPAPEAEASSNTKPETEDALSSSQGNSEEHRKDAEAHAKAAAAQAEADEKKQQALAMATANKNSAKEERIRKINEMRKPWMGGAASSSSGSDAMVAPPITPASQVPPPPFQ